MIKLYWLISWKWLFFFWLANDFVVVKCICTCSFVLFGIFQLSYEWRKSYISLQYIHQCSFWSDHDEHRKLWMARDRLIIFVEEKHPFCHVEFNAEVLVKIVIYPTEQIHRKIVINWCVEVQEPNVLGQVFPTDLNTLLFRKQIFFVFTFLHTIFQSWKVGFFFPQYVHCVMIP